MYDGRLDMRAVDTVVNAPAPAVAEATELARSSRVLIGRTWIDNVDFAEAVARVDALVAARVHAMVITPNVDHVVRAEQDADYAELVRQADLVLADGQPLVWAARLLGTPLKARVTGSDLFPLVCALAARTGRRVFFLGGDPGVAEEARALLEAAMPGLRVVGTHCPPVGFEQDPVETRLAVERVRAAAPQIVFVGLGSPKQERWIARHRYEYGPAVSIGVGISFSFVAGRVARAPRWMQRVGLEWLHRLSREPRRLWRRYLVRDPAFLGIVARQWRTMRGRTAEATN
jgi:N-acetylglucosaminyldiphosphoundecaprenol N-acetyl-beta-D-mannosaminyltransferase